MNLYDYQEEAARLLVHDPRFQSRAEELRRLLNAEEWKDADVWKRCATLIGAMHAQTVSGGRHADRR